MEVKREGKSIFSVPGTDCVIMEDWGDDILPGHEWVAEGLNVALSGPSFEAVRNSLAILLGS